VTRCRETVDGALACPANVQGEAKQCHSPNLDRLSIAEGNVDLPFYVEKTLFCLRN
jgi:hypothetical protein